MKGETLEQVEAARSSGFELRHIGPSPAERDEMIKLLGARSVAEFIGKVVPETIRSKKPLHLSQFSSSADEPAVLARLAAMASKNKVARSFLGLGYYNCNVPGVIQRNILENPGWYTQYTPYQPEISQGRLEALLNFQTMVGDLTGLPIANASLLDEGTAAAEAMNLCRNVHERGEGESNKFFVADSCFPQTIAVVRVRAEALGVEIVCGDSKSFAPTKEFFGALLQYPCAEGSVSDHRKFIEQAHAEHVLVVMASDLLALTLLTPPGELGADVAVGSSQRFGVPLGFGGPHAGFLATKDEFKRQIPGRIVGLSQDRGGKPALRLALQTREQHIRREKATSNICTAQVLLAVMAGMYAAYHGPEGLRSIARRVNLYARTFAAAVKKSGAVVAHENFFDTVVVQSAKAPQIKADAEREGINLRLVGNSAIAVAFDESVTRDELALLVRLFGAKDDAQAAAESIPSALSRTSTYLTHPVFHRYHSETEMLRYIRRLESRDLSLATAMIPLGSCTMKLNATSEMVPVSWKEWGGIHPFAPAGQTGGYALLFEQLESALSDITGFTGVSLQPNAGSQGEYAGLLVIREYYRRRNDTGRTVCLIPRSAHGTNPASAAMAGMRVVVVECDQSGNVDLVDLRKKAQENAQNLAALMVTYPSTHGVFEEEIRTICSIVHESGGQVYMDGANLNALVGLCRPAELGVDVAHINLHKTFCIPHGGGGPGMGPIGVAAHLAPYLPNHPLVACGGAEGIGPISAAPWGSASILTISWVYIALMGAEGLRRATEMAIVNANYIAARLGEKFPVLFRGKGGYVAHECILDLRPLKKMAGVEVDDVAKRLIDYGFHAPTVSWPVAGTIMVEPTESESKAELDRFCDAMLAIYEEAKSIERKELDPSDNPLKNAPHTAHEIVAGEWKHSYTREQAAFPTAFVREHKFWPAVARVDAAYGDKNLVCSCPPLSEY